ncbi:hypothetical protein [Clostridium sp.]|uniref:hypothetical protein n=1 Tax=Clostridium sp. TaxID=1506 RepID=UPI003F321065
MQLIEKNIEEKIKHLRKSIEIVGGANLLQNDFKNDTYIVSYILDKTLKGENVEFDINNCTYKIDELLKIKSEYEKNLIKTKRKYTESILFKIKKYNTEIDSLVRKYKKSTDITQYNEIRNKIEGLYRIDINNYLLNQIKLNDIRESLEVNYYGEYLLEKKDQLLTNILRALGIEH